MTDDEALLAAVCANPDEDTPRLIYADLLEEQGETERAAFIRAQIQLARTPRWEPFAVFCHRRRSDWFTGNRFLATLPSVDGFNIEWPRNPFRRGFGGALYIRTLLTWEQRAAAILERAPIGEVHLWGAPILDHLRTFAASAVVRQLRKLHLRHSPIEPLRALRERPESPGIQDIYFEKSSGAGMPEVLEDLLLSPLGKALGGLHFRMGYESLFELIGTLAGHAPPGLRRLSFTAMGLTREHIRQLLAGTVLNNIAELSLGTEDALENEGVRELLSGMTPGLESLALVRVRLQADGLEALAGNAALASLKELDLSENTLTPRSARILARSRNLASLRRLQLSGCRLGDKAVRHLTRAKFWPGLVELNLANNPISSEGMNYLLDVSVPTDLTALVLDAVCLERTPGEKLRKKYGERLVVTSFPVD